MIPDRHWNTWDALHPARMVHLPSGFTISVGVYSARTSDFRELDDCDRIFLGEHTPDGDHVELTAVHANSTVRLTFAKASPFTLVGCLRVEDTGEWALRFWSFLLMGFPEAGRGGVRGAPATILEPSGAPYRLGPTVRAVSYPHEFALATSPRGVRADCYEDLDTLRDELVHHGYYYPPAERRTGRWAAVRFNAQEQSEWWLAVASGTDSSSARRAADDSLKAATAVMDARTEGAARPPVAARAVRDVVAWNTVWEAPNARVVTTATRSWVASKFGGWGIWLNDALLNALLAACSGDFTTAYANVDAAFAGLQPAGNLPCLLTAYDAWIDRSQPPLAAYLLWRIYQRTRERDFLEQHLKTLIRSHTWWFAHRDGNHNGVLEYGSSPTGSGTFVHSKQAAMDEAAMDNLPIFDDARFDLDAHTLDLEEVGLNSLLVLDAQMIEAIANELGRGPQVEAIAERGRDLATTIRTKLWDEGREVFAGRWWSGDLHRAIAATSFYPLIAGIPTREQATALVERHLLNEDEFWGPRPLPVTPFNDPATADDVYWRGRIWPPVLFLVWDGLRRYGFHEAARALARRASGMFEDGWAERRCHENYHRSDPRMDIAPDSDPFYAWGALLPLLILLEGADAEPWEEGIRISSDRDLNPWLPLPGGTVTARRSVDALTVAFGGRRAVGLEPASDLRGLVMGKACTRLVLPPAPAPRLLRLYDVRPDHIVAVRIRHTEAPWNGERDSVSVTIPPSSEPSEISCYLRAASSDRSRGWR